MSSKDRKVAVIGLGYVGLPLSVVLARHHHVVGFDIDERRVASLKRGDDATGEVDAAALLSSSLGLTADRGDLADANIFIVTVPTPIDQANRPDFRALLGACETVGAIMPKGAIIVFESTVYPGVTEEICGPALERASGLVAGRDFTLGYSPERINPGDKARPLEKIVKVVAGQDAATLDALANLYGSIIEAGIHRAPSIKVAEAAKVIENSQRDLNIALMNEVSKICDLMDIRTADVLAAAGTKWNFLNFHPGLVGGHCIGVDPYYLTAKAEELGYRPEVILSGRRINDGMGAHIAQKTTKLLARLPLPLKDMRVGILGFTFKENVPDIRNSKVIDIVRELQSFGIEPLIHDPLADAAALAREYGVSLTSLDAFADLHALIVAVPHRDYEPWDAAAYSAMVAKGGVIVDVRARLDPAAVRDDLTIWSL
ncbi:nucleotide sugar dehydrogenase [Sphingomonas jaspsi]|uniref:nucleotide sugar dehydrogenase n=1 Tax=Sphingomonas jaspsi TaxID=392409 RepID=UPI0004B7F8DF|nr:nucleotide sugar dehydrogenase [Sphingomonas jaspsi]